MHPRRKKWILVGALTFVATFLLNIATLPDDPAHNFLPVIEQGFGPGGKEWTAVLPQAFLESLSDARRSALMRRMRERFGDVKVMTRAQSSLFRYEHRGNWGKHVFLDAQLSRGFLSVEVARGYMAGRLNGSGWRRTYIWLFGWRMVKEVLWVS